VRSGKLEWSPVHRTDRFWAENAQRLDENNYELVKVRDGVARRGGAEARCVVAPPATCACHAGAPEQILAELLERSQDKLVLAVAAHDVGEYVRFHPRGKRIIERLGLKSRVMQMMVHEDA
jgi:V-type H+-transporting ATPase subunit H